MTTTVQSITINDPSEMENFPAKQNRSDQASSDSMSLMLLLTVTSLLNQTELSNQNQQTLEENFNKKIEILGQEIREANNKIQNLEGENENYQIEAEVLEAESSMLNESLEKALTKAEAAEKRLRVASAKAIYSTTETPLQKNRIFKQRLLRWKKRLESNPTRIWRKLNLTEQNLPRFGTIEQTTKQLAADKLLQETTLKTSTQTKETAQKIQKAIQKANSELAAVRTETAQLKTNIEILNLRQKQAAQKTTASERTMQETDKKFQIFQVGAEKLKRQMAKDLKVKDLSALEYQIEINTKQQNKIHLLQNQILQLNDKIDSIPHRLQEARESAISGERKAERRFEWTYLLLKWATAPLILVTIASSCYFSTSQDLSENLAAEKETTKQLSQRLRQTQDEKTTTDLNFNNTVTTLRRIIPSVDQFYNLAPEKQQKFIQSALKQTAARQKKRRK